MAITQEQFDHLTEIFNDAGYDTRSYGGRGMYGAKCMGVTCPDPVRMMKEFTDSLLDNVSNSIERIENEDTDDLLMRFTDKVKETLDLLRRPSQDSMGRDAIVYWQSIGWMGGDKSEDEDEE